MPRAISKTHFRDLSIPSSLPELSLTSLGNGSSAQLIYPPAQHSYWNISAAGHQLIITNFMLSAFNKIAGFKQQQQEEEGGKYG